jgi:hypothetical protein
MELRVSRTYKHPDVTKERRRTLSPDKKRTGTARSLLQVTFSDGTQHTLVSAFHFRTSRFMRKHAFHCWSDFVTDFNDTSKLNNVCTFDGVDHTIGFRYSEVVKYKITYDRANVPVPPAK